MKKLLFLAAFIFCATDSQAVFPPDIEASINEIIDYTKLENTNANGINELLLKLQQIVAQKEGNGDTYRVDGASSIAIVQKEQADEYSYNLTDNVFLNVTYGNGNGGEYKIDGLDGLNNPKYHIYRIGDDSLTINMLGANGDKILLWSLEYQSREEQQCRETFNKYSLLSDKLYYCIKRLNVLGFCNQIQKCGLSLQYDLPGSDKIHAAFSEIVFADISVQQNIDDLSYFLKLKNSDPIFIQCEIFNKKKQNSILS